VESKIAKIKNHVGDMDVFLKLIETYLNKLQKKHNGLRLDNEKLQSMVTLLNHKPLVRE
jgi:hypothetical protein